MAATDVTGPNAAYVAQLLEDFLDSPASVPDEWRRVFEAADARAAADGAPAGGGDGAPAPAAAPGGGAGARRAAGGAAASGGDRPPPRGALAGGVSRSARCERSRHDRLT